MEGHKPDWISAAFGIVFAAIGTGLLIGNLKWAAINTTAFWAFSIIGLGILIAGSALYRIVSGPDSAGRR